MTRMPRGWYNQDGAGGSSGSTPPPSQTAPPAPPPPTAPPTQAPPAPTQAAPAPPPPTSTVQDLPGERPLPPPPQGWSATAWEEHLTNRRRRQEAEKLAEEASRQAAEATQAAQRMALALQDERMNFAMLQTGGDLAHPDVQRFFREQYRAATAHLEAQAPDFGTWLQSDQVRQSPLYGRYFPQPPAAPAWPQGVSGPVPPTWQPPAPTAPAPQTAPPAATPAPTRTAPPNVDAGAATTGPPQSTLVSDAQIGTWARGDWVKHRDATIAAKEAQYGISLGSRRRKVKEQ